MVWNFPNILTISRIVLTFIFVILASNAGVMFADEPTFTEMTLRWIAYVCAIIAGLTDFADGYLARNGISRAISVHCLIRWRIRFLLQRR